MNVATSQKGVSLLGGLLILVVLGFAFSAGLKLAPHYFDYWSLKKIISSVETEKAVPISTVSDFYNHVRAGMQVNNIQDVDLNKALSVTLEDNVFLAHLKYEEREPLIQNIDLVVKFDHEFSVRKP
ncbi:MAG: DUF4845 domain-containing protein [Pseudomonas sp.]|uniref:DUF4845 domain-containing protein n=1 Tax=Pseudomonas abieticivorans TaxID=2931382 RepID=UPI0020BFA5E2|nr:DUF4845 domain-containing protein [Pseudomonas sp. PIA16]MDE1167999.1 DUF4845 domain-containing protein [Pseudomonas sp.]